jgi:hypothetical protein
MRRPGSATFRRCQKTHNTRTHYVMLCYVMVPILPPVNCVEDSWGWRLHARSAQWVARLTRTSSGQMCEALLVELAECENVGEDGRPHRGGGTQGSGTRAAACAVYYYYYYYYYRGVRGCRVGRKTTSGLISNHAMVLGLGSELGLGLGLGLGSARMSGRTDDHIWMGLCVCVGGGSGTGRQAGRQAGRQPVSQSVSQPVSQSVNQPASQPVSQSVSQPASHSVSQSVSQPVSQFSQSGRQAGSQAGRQIGRQAGRQAGT